MTNAKVPLPVAGDGIDQGQFLTILSREEAIARMRSALGEVVIEGVDTNVDYLYSILNEEEYLAGRADIEFVERLTERL